MSVHEDLSFLFLAIALIFASIFGAYAFSSLRTKQRRIATLMAPASMLEKYLVRITVNVICFYVIFVIGAVLACCTHYIWMQPYESSTKYLMIPKLICDNSDYIKFIVAAQAMYVLGSVIWPKYSFFKTFIALFVLSIVLPTLIIDAVSVLKGWFFIVVAILCYALAWWRFRRVQVIQRFM